MFRSGENGKPLYLLTNIAKTYVPGEGPVITVPFLEIPRGQVVALIGYSGSGKTTLLNLLAMLETPDHQMELLQDGRSLKFVAESDGESEELLLISAERRQELRATFGFVFQQGYLFENLTCRDNIKVPFHVRKLDSRGSNIAELMRMVGLPGTLSERNPSDISGGERQRISVLRALAHNPSVVFADEPTSNLDEANATVVLTGLHSWQRAGSSRTIIFVTHNIGHAAKYADSIIFMAPGRILGPVPNVPAGSGLRTSATQLSIKLAEFSEDRSATTSQAIRAVLPDLVIPSSPPALHPFGNLCHFIVSFALADVFPRVSSKARKGLLQRLFKRRNAQFHCMASMFFALLLALFFANLYSALSSQFRSLIEDKRIARIEVLGRHDGERLLSQKDVDELSGLSLARGQGTSQISIPEEMHAKGLRKIRPVVDAAVGYRVREMRLAKNSARSGVTFNPESNLSVVSTRASDPILRKLDVMSGDRVRSMAPGTKTLSSIYVDSPGNQLGLVCTKAALIQLGFTDVPPASLDIYPPFSSSASPESLPLVAVTEWLPKSADILITDDLFQRFFFQGGRSGDPLPRFESVDLYFEDIMKDGVGLYEALQRLGYSTSADRLGFLRWVVGLIRAIQYFSLVAGLGVFVVVFITLMVSYSEAIRRKEKEIGVLLAYGTRLSVLYAVFLTEVGFVWLVAIALALPAQWIIVSAVDRLVAVGFRVQSTQGVAGSLPVSLWLLILGCSLGVAIISVVFTLRKIDPKRVAQILRAAE